MQSGEHAGVREPKDSASGAKSTEHQLFALLRALPAVCLRASEEVGHFRVATTFGISDEGIHLECIGQTRFREPDQVWSARAISCPSGAGKVALQAFRLEQGVGAGSHRPRPE